VVTRHRSTYHVHKSSDDATDILTNAGRAVSQVKLWIKNPRELHIAALHLPAQEIVMFAALHTKQGLHTKPGLTSAPFAAAAAWSHISVVPEAEVSC
jgi:hypothetical protein